MKTGIELIAEERQEQIEKHGRTIATDVHDNDKFQLVNAAIAILYSDGEESPLELIISFGKLKDWNLDIIRKIDEKPYKERLIIAGALIAAEIDRLQNH